MSFKKIKVITNDREGINISAKEDPDTGELVIRIYTNEEIKNMNLHDMLQAKTTRLDNNTTVYISEREDDLEPKSHITLIP